MKKILILTSLFVAGIYLSSGIDIVLTGGNILSLVKWNEMASVLNKVDVSGDNLKINGKLAVIGKICDENNNCLGECKDGKIWDLSTSSCVTPATTPQTAGLSCEDLYNNKGIRTSGLYYIKPTGYTEEAFQVYCDMTHQGGGWALVAYDTDTTSLSFQSIVDYNTLGAMQNTKWQSLRINMTTGMIFIDEHGRVTYISKSKLLSGSCIPLRTTLIPGGPGYIYHHETSGCGPSGGDYTIVTIEGTSSVSSLRNSANVKFDIWPYASAANASYTNQMRYYIK